MRKVVVAAGILASAGVAAGYGMAASSVPEPPVVIGVVQLSPVDIDTFEGFKVAMAARGYHEGKGTTYLYSGPAGTVDHLPALVRAQLAQGVDLLVTSSTPATIAATEAAAARKVPIIFAPVNDPVAVGIVENLAHPGGGVTGVKLPAGDDLRLQWLTRIAPDVRDILVPYNPADRSALNTVEVITEAARLLKVTLHLREVESPGDLEIALRSMPETIQAIFLPRDSLVESMIDEVVRHANQRRLPVAAPSLQQVERGAMFAYGFSHRDVGAQAARLASHVLNGIAAGDIPVESAESRLIINLKTAEEIGRHIPDEVLVLADSVRRP